MALAGGGECGWAAERAGRSVPRFKLACVVLFETCGRGWTDSELEDCRVCADGGHGGGAARAWCSHGRLQTA
eukprot:466906-Rhodomonas_salina.1